MTYEFLGLLLLPLIGFLLILLLPARFSWALALLTGVFNLGLGLYGFSKFQIQNYLPETKNIFAILPDFGIGFVQTADTLAWWFVLLALLFFVLVFLGQWGRNTENPKMWFGNLLILQTGLVGFFTSGDMIFFYLFLELTLLPIALLIGRRSEESALWFLIYTLAGSFLLLASLIAIGWLHHAASGVWSFNYWDWFKAQPVPQAWQLPLLIFIFLAFAVKLHLFPLHTWLFRVTAQAPMAVNALLMGVLMLMGAFGMWRLAVWLLPLAWAQFSDLAVVLAVIGILYAAGVAATQKTVVGVLTFAAISHAGFIFLGLALGSPLALSGAVFQTLSDAINFGALFLLVGMLTSRGLLTHLDQLGGLAKSLPALTFYFLVLAFAVMGLPGLNSFVGEFSILWSLFKVNWFWAVLAASVLIWGAVYMLNLVKQIFWGAENTASSLKIKDLSVREHLMLLPILALVLWLGIYPKPVLDALDQNQKFMQAYKKAPVGVKR